MTIREVEQRIDFLERWILSGISNMKIWSSAVSEYHRLNIKLCLMTGKNPIVTHSKPEHII